MTHPQAALSPLDIALAPGAEDNGLAIMLADLLRQNIEAKPHKKSDFNRLRGTVSIVADDADVALTLRFDRGRLAIHDGIVGIPDVTIRGPADAILALSNMPLMTRFGLPFPHPRDPEAVRTVRGIMTMMREGKLHAYGMGLHLPLVMKLTRVMSVNG
ncbi:MAG: SCP2 sterol-binding domain-containing protein [Polyangiaceae bacterium]